MLPRIRQEKQRAADPLAEEQVRAIMAGKERERDELPAHPPAIETAMQLSVFERPLNQCSTATIPPGQHGSGGRRSPLDPLLVSIMKRRIINTIPQSRSRYARFIKKAISARSPTSRLIDRPIENRNYICKAEINTCSRCRYVTK